jgi:hypothetical protein
MSALSPHGIPIRFAGFDIPVDCRPEHVAYCQFLADRLQPVAAEILRASPDVSRLEMVFLIALSLADERYGAEFDWGQSDGKPQEAAPLPMPAGVSQEHMALHALFRDLG